jgi:predicted transcriptional regulator
MLKSITIGARISPQLDASLARLANFTGRPKSWHLCEAIRAYVAGEQDFIAAVKEGLADARAGRVVDHAAVVRHFEKRFKKTSKR